MSRIAITCPICQSSASGSDNNTAGVYRVECETCDTYYITSSLGT